MFDDTYAFYCYLKEKGAVFDISKIGTNEYETIPEIKENLGLAQQYVNLTPQEKRVYEEKANYLTEEEIRYVQIHIAPIFEVGHIASMWASNDEASKSGFIDAHFDRINEIIDTNNNIIVGEIGLKYPGYLLNLNELDYRSAGKYTDYRIIDIDPNQTDILFKVEDVASKQIEQGRWNVFIDFTIKNIGSNDISISNIEVFLNYRDISRGTLTIGDRDGLDLTRYRSLKDEGKYYKLVPQEEQKVTIKLCINRWWGVPQNSINGSIRALFSISIDYHTILNNTDFVLKKILPIIFNFDYSTHTSKDGNAIYIYDNNIDTYYKKHRGRKELIRVLTSISDFLNLAKCKVIIIWESTINGEDVQGRKPLIKNKEKVKIFISYSHNDHAFAEKLMKALESKGIAVWLDKKEIMPGDSIIQEIKKGIEGSNYVCAILSENSVDSEWVQNELDTAMNIQLREKKVIVLPILLNRDIDLPSFLDGKLYIDFSKEELFGDGIDLIMRRIDKDRICLQENTNV